MQFGVVRKRTPGERRVALTPNTVDRLTRAGHGVLPEEDDGERPVEARHLPDVVPIMPTNPGPLQRGCVLRGGQPCLSS